LFHRPDQRRARLPDALRDRQEIWEAGDELTDPSTGDPLRLLVNVEAPILGGISASWNAAVYRRLAERASGRSWSPMQEA